MTEVLWGNLRAPALRALAARGALAIVPVGSIEQHGPHLPVQVDALLAGEIARRAAVKVAKKQPVVVAPTIWSGLAEHHMSLGGTITLDLPTFHAVIRCVCASILRHGFKRILILNGHGGNIAALTVLVGELARDLDASIATATYWTMPETQASFAKILKKQKTVRHACEAETSMLLVLKPELVDRAAARSVRAPIEGLAPEDGIYRYRPIAHWTKSGVLGVPSAASVDKGEKLLEAAAASVANAILAGKAWRSDDASPRKRKGKRS